jgi:hypothetical protein
VHIRLERYLLGLSGGAAKVTPYSSLPAYGREKTEAHAQASPSENRVTHVSNAAPSCLGVKATRPWHGPRGIPRFTGDATNLIRFGILSLRCEDGFVCSRLQQGTSDFLPCRRALVSTAMSSWRSAEPFVRMPMPRGTGASLVARGL